MAPWRSALLAAALSACLAGGLRAQPPDPEIQREFIEGARRLQAGDYEEAARIFRALTLKTGSPRIKLELARTLFFLRQYQESREIFKAVALEPELPWRVRDNIEGFLRAIDNIEGFVRFSASIVTDSNPRNITREREFTIGGVRLTFEPPQDSQRVTGLRYSMRAQQPLARERRLTGYFTGSYLDYPGSSLDRFTVDLGVARGLVGAFGSVKLGMEAGTFGGRGLYEFPYLDLGQRLSESPVYRLDGSVRGGRVNFPHFDHLDANYGSATLSGARALTQASAASLDASIEVSDARERPYTYYGVSAQPGLSLLAEATGILVNAAVPLAYRKYAAEDPLFGARRRDRRIGLDFSIRRKQWRLMDYTPALVLSVERNQSNLSFYSYRKANVALVLE